MRLIDANALKVKGFADPETGEGIIYVQDIDEAPTVDAVEVVHGRWALITGDIHRCTNCGCTNHVKTVMGLPDWNYCPNCGADMRERKDNDL